jgi:hypothetical protein
MIVELYHGRISRSEVLLVSSAAYPATVGYTPRKATAGASPNKVCELILFTVAQLDYINNGKSDLLKLPEEVGLPPVSRKGLLDCDEYSFNYEKPCTAEGER